MAVSVAAKMVVAGMVAAANSAFVAGGGCWPSARCRAAVMPLRLVMMTVPLTDMTDADLLRAYANGTGAAAEELARRLLPGALAQATRMLADRAAAEDVAQDALMRLWRQAPIWRDGEAQVSTWLYRVVSNLCIDDLRKRKRNVPLDAVADPADPRESAADQLQTRARLSALSAALAHLPERQAQAVALRHLEGLSNPEIAEIMDISVRSVESLTARGKRALADQLAGRRAELGYDDA